MVITLLTAVLTPQIRTDCISLGKTIANAFLIAKNWIMTVAAFVSQLGDKIPQPVIANIVHWILYVLVVIAIIGGTGFLIFLIARKYIRYFKKYQADQTSGWVALMDLAIVVFLGEEIRKVVPVNLLLLLPLVFMGYLGCRAMVKK